MWSGVTGTVAVLAAGAQNSNGWAPAQNRVAGTVAVLAAAGGRP